MQNRSARLPIHGKGATVKAYGVLLSHVGGHKGDGIEGIGVFGLTVSPVLPHGGHVDGVPIANATVGEVEIPVGILGQIPKAIVAVQGADTAGLLFILIIYASFLRRNRGGSGRQAVDMQQFLIFNIGIVNEKLIFVDHNASSHYKRNKIF
jgi:hypothetical protein